ncbi:hypothetical protein PSTG_16492 [Puccinia striiformis f. sp. tritici PST-78]|uniref:Uncharacterized protein n=1 Tax=Puccinia striiformis f. sp. tritici PST-78 TaxID=1165861 RepID=A0A0L0USK1_9BASI|nr:hypothetical protein PSTG_16492 [Puccinia striiformis f. sp. tritici PST-78]
MYIGAAFLRSWVGLPVSSNWIDHPAVFLIYLLVAIVICGPGFERLRIGSTHHQSSNCFLLVAVVMRGPDSSLDGPSSLPITRFHEGHSPPFRDILVSSSAFLAISAWVLRRYGWKFGSSVVFGVLLMGLASSSAFVDGKFKTTKGAPLIRFTPFSSFLISSPLSDKTAVPLAFNFTAMSQQPRPAPYQRTVFHPHPIPYPPPYQRVASHPYSLRPRVAPIRGYGPVPRPSPVHPSSGASARRPGFVPRPLTPMPVIRNGPFLLNPVRPAPSTPARRAANVHQVVDSPANLVSNSYRIGDRGAPVMSANVRDPRFLMGNQFGIRADSANPFLSPVYNPNTRGTPMYPPSPVFDCVIRHPSPFPFPPDWSVFFRDITESSQGSSAGRRMDLDIPLVDRIGPQASGSSNVSSRANSAIVVPPAPRPRNMSTPPSSPHNPPGYVPSPRAATWGQRRRSESSTPGRPSSARDSSAASVAEQAEIVTYHTLDVDQIHMLLEQPEGLNPYDRHVFSNRVPKDKYCFAVVRFIRLCHDHPTTNQAERDGRVAFFKSLRYLRRPDATTSN